MGAEVWKMRRRWGTWYTHLYKQYKLCSRPEAINVCGGRGDTQCLYTIHDGGQITRTGTMGANPLASAAWELPWMSVGEVAGGGGGERKDHVLCLRPVYMRPLSDLPFLETPDEARVGLDAGPVSLHEGKGKLV